MPPYRQKWKKKTQLSVTYCKKTSTKLTGIHHLRRFVSKLNNYKTVSAYLKLKTYQQVDDYTAEFPCNVTSWDWRKTSL